MSLLSSKGRVTVGIVWVGVRLVATGFVEAAIVFDVEDELLTVDEGLLVDVVLEIVVGVEDVDVVVGIVMGRLVVVTR